MLLTIIRNSKGQNINFIKAQMVEMKDNFDENVGLKGLTIQ